MSEDTTSDMTLQLQFHLFHSKLSLRLLYDFDLQVNEAIDVYDFIRHLIVLLSSLRQ